ncbi:FAD-dependent oxidoreductase [Rhizobium anhuiense]|uniref:NAD(P)/FAD-dependent oxidoreductase n=1 Tax=Rhizobium TaxID=379 RepID=UPI000BE8787F|nr:MULTISPECIES: FAD-binding oxidoreductase [Rhizobium]MBB4253988.1 glycine/D-amino acid oxidase-like deaminating enzyme [Rhizobium sp. BK008]NKM54998.1 FAD-dependent oxidoreductase [Rhizobium anhuiense]PDS33745.1 FAD-dependent oxidoreductase [Rhizobium anhuiense]
MQASKSSYDVVIVGGAVVGSSTAYFLATNPDFNGSVLVIEKDWTYQRSATALSSSSIRHQFSNAINVKVSQFGTEFIRNFKENVAIDDDTPEIGFHEAGYLFLAEDERGDQVLRRNHETQISCGADVTLLDPGGLGRRFPWLNLEGLTLGSTGERGEGWFDSVGLLQGFRKKARSLGVEYIEDEVVAVNREGDRMVSVSTKSGQTIACGTMVNTSGTNGKKVARMAGLDVPVEPRRRSLFVVDCRTPLEGKVGLTIDPTGVFFRPEGKFYLMGTYPKHDPEVDPNDFDVMHDEFDEEIWPIMANRVPAFEAIKVVNSWAGHYDYCTLDHNVVLGPHTEVSNFLFANGFSGHGLQQSPAMGRGLSELIAYGGFKTLDLSPFGYERVTANRPFLEDAVI